MRTEGERRPSGVVFKQELTEWLPSLIFFIKQTFI